MVELIDLPKISDPRGSLTFLEHGAGLPFVPRRVFWTIIAPGGSMRGGHAHTSQCELIIALNGAFDVVMKSPEGYLTRFRLDRGNMGLLLPPLTWHWMETISTNGMGLHISDTVFNKADYIQDFLQYQKHSQP